MRIAILADIHGNLPALRAVLADLARVKPDQVIVAGDFQNRGPEPEEVTRTLFERGWPMLRGNHEDYVLWQSEGLNVPDVLDHYSWLPARWTAGVTREWLGRVRALPIAVTIPSPTGPPVLVAHGSPRSNSEGVFPSTPDDTVRSMLGGSAPAVFCCGHSHLPLIRYVDGTLTFNVGSVGFPFDGDQRAAYGLIELTEGGWEAELRRVPYVVEETLEVFTRTDFPKRIGPLAGVIRRELESARPHLTAFCEFYGPLLRAGELTVFDAVDAYLATPQQDIEERFLERRRRRHNVQPASP